MASVSKYGRKMIAVAILLAAFATLRASCIPEIPRPVVRFMYFYQEAEKTAPMNLWERVVYSLLLTKSSAPTSS